MRQNIGRLGESVSPRLRTRSREEIQQYLSYVLERFPQYEALFLLAPDGEPLFWVGSQIELPELLRRRLAGTTHSRVSDIHLLEGRRIQVASAVVNDGRENKPLASLHALVGIEMAEAVLQGRDLGSAGGLYIVGREGQTLLRSADAAQHNRNAPPLVASLEPKVEEYTHDDGKHVVGSAMEFARFEWTIVVEQAYDDAFAPMVSVIREVTVINLGIVLALSMIAYQLARVMVRPLLALSDGALRIATGETNVVVSGPTSSDEIGVLTRTFNQMAARLCDNQEQLEQNRVEIEDANARLTAQNLELHRVTEVFQQLSITDDLTKLHNHRFFREQLPREMKRAERTGEPLALILIDLDDFKKLNDRFGHAVGDAVLRKSADVMSGVIRDTDLLARYGGEEFALLASHTSVEGALALAEKIRRAVSEARFSVVNQDGPAELSVTASFGVAAFNGDERAFFNEADQALYRAKDSGKDCVVAADGA